MYFIKEDEEHVSLLIIDLVLFGNEIKHNQNEKTLINRCG